MSPNSSTADYLVPLTPLSNPTTPPPPSDSTVASPCSDIPESHSTETILEDDEPDTGQQREFSKNYKDRQRSNSKAGPSCSRPNLTSALNGIDNGITLTPSSLNSNNINVTVNPTSDNVKTCISSNSNSKPIASSVGGSKKKIDKELGDEIRC